jgi:hypothetical protein
MPGEEATGKGKIYNLSWNVQSGSHANRTAGKMCKKGTQVPGSKLTTRTLETDWVNAGTF